MLPSIAYGLVIFAVILLIYAEMRHREVGDHFLVFLFGVIIGAPLIGFILIIAHQFLK